jgi:hypothetical protein
MKYLIVLLFATFSLNLFAADNREEELKNLKFNISLSKSNNSYKDYTSNSNAYFYYKLSIPDSTFKKFKDDIKISFEPESKGVTVYEDEKYVIWRDPDAGAHKIKITASTPYHNSTVTKEIYVEEEWNSAFIPGISYTNYLPHDSKKFGTYQGVSVEYLIFAGIHRNDNRGPSHVRVYNRYDLLTSSIDSVREAFIYSLGLNLSFERNPKRNFLIPYFGIEIGGLYQKEMGNIFNFTAVGGIWLYTSQNIFVNLAGGYFYPIEKIEDYRGFRGTLGINLSLW